MALVIGTRLGSYEILSALGAGGMGEVYRAKDTKLGREVAIKVLPADVARDAERLSRFQREARAIAALNHPNIVTLYSVEQSDDTHFLTMELVEGQGLDRAIPPGGMAVDQIVQIAGALADALAAAHDKGIIHRDLKPANVMLTHDGRVKVLDFGLAKDVGESSSIDVTRTSSPNTQAGIVMGTPAYMSPEQVAGRPLDHRADIFALGVVMHEMTTGKRPFEGNSSAELISSILRDVPPLVTELRDDAPADLARVIRRCMEKDPRHRIQTARDVSNEFRDISRGIRPVTKPVSVMLRATKVPDSGAARAEEGFWVGVLPFKYRGGDGALQSLAEEFSEELASALSKFRYLRVVGTGAAHRQTADSGDVRAIATELGARYVLEGSLRQAGSTLRIAVQLLDATTGVHIWTESFDRPADPENLFTLIDATVPRIASTVGDIYGVLVRSMSKAVRAVPVEQLTAYEAMLRSFGFGETGTKEELLACRTAAEWAVKKDPKLAEAWAFLSILHLQDYAHAYQLHPDAVALGSDAAQCAVDLGPASHFAYCALAQVLFFQKDFGAMRHAIDKSVALNPCDSSIIALLAEFLAFTGDISAGLALADRAMELNPNHPGWYWYVNWYDAYHRRDYEAARDFLLKAKLRSNYPVHMMLAAVYGQLGDTREAAKELELLRKAHADIDRVLPETNRRWHRQEFVEHLQEGLKKAGFVFPGAPESKQGIQSLAVLPLVIQGGDADSEYLSEGIAESLINRFSEIPGLRVVQQQKSFRYRGSDVDLQSVGRELSVQVVLNGKLVVRGDTLIVKMSLVDVEKDAQTWGQQFTKRIADVLIVQEQIADEVLQALEVKLNVAPTKKIVRPSQTGEAYNFYLKGRYFWNKRTPDNTEKALQFFRQSIDADPTYALAYAGVADCYTNLGFTPYGTMKPDDAYPKARAAAEKALQLEPALGEAYGALGLCACFYDWDFVAAEAHFRKALELSPQALGSTTWFPFTLAQLGKHEEAIAMAKARATADPLSVHEATMLGQVLYFARRYDDSLNVLRGAVEIDDKYPSALIFLGVVHQARGEYAEAIHWMERSVAINPHPVFRSHLGLAYGEAGREEDAIRILNLLTEQSKTRYVAAINYSFLHLGLGDLEKWYRAMQAAVRDREPLLTVMASPWFDSVRSVPEFREIVQQVGLPAWVLGSRKAAM